MGIRLHPSVTTQKGKRDEAAMCNMVVEKERWKTILDGTSLMGKRGLYRKC